MHTLITIASKDKQWENVRGDSGRARPNCREKSKSQGSLGQSGYIEDAVRFLDLGKKAGAQLSTGTGDVKAGAR